MGTLRALNQPRTMFYLLVRQPTVALAQGDHSKVGEVEEFTQDLTREGTIIKQM